LKESVLYYPKGLYVWDTWYLNRPNETHLFHLQVKRPDSTRPDKEDGTIGHAVSKDLLNWKEYPTALYRGYTGSYDEGHLCTGYAVEHEDTIYLYYAGNQHTNGRGQTICLATSKDRTNFVKHKDNPIIKPDGIKYAEGACRDIAVLKNPEGEGWLGYVVMRLNKKKKFNSYSIVLCRSTDLVNWEIGEPCFKPDRYNIFEVPEVFSLNNRWYMICLTGDFYGQRNRWRDQNINFGTIVAEAKKPIGPFTEVKDNVLLATNNYQGYSARTVEVDGERLLFYTRPESNCKDFTRGSLSWPLKLEPRKEGGLRLKYWKGINKFFNQKTKAPSISLQVDKNEGWILQPINIKNTQSDSIMASATISLQTARAAGLAVRYDIKPSHYGYYIALLDTVNSEVALLKPEFVTLQRLSWNIKSGNKYNIRVIAIDSFIEIYVNDILVINCYDQYIDNGGIALFIEEGKASFSNIEYNVV
jgi:beta-fructofuranosidase